jgi:hypothetical protein
VEEAVEVVLFYHVLMVEAVEVVVVRGHSVKAVVEEVLTH